MVRTKIIIISTVGLIYDGITSVILSYLQAMSLKEFEIYVVATMKVEPCIQEKIEEAGCHIVNLPSRRTKTAKYFLLLSSFIRKNGINVMHAHGNSATLAIEMAAGWLGGCKKRIAHSHNTRCDQVNADKIMRPMFNLLYTNALACGEEAGKWLFGMKKFTVLPNGRNVDEFAYDGRKRDAVRSEYEIQDEIVIGHVGGFFKQKNHIFLLEIYREILKKEPFARLFMIGDGPLKEEIERNAADIYNSIVFTGTTDRVADYLQAMDGMLLPSLFEGLPLVAVEWQINGLPCILADTITKDCAFTDTVAFMSLEDSAEKWAENIIQMVKNNDKKINSFSARGKVKAAGFDICDNVEQLSRIYLNN